MKHPQYGCPKCASVVTRRCEVVYEESVIQGPNSDTARLSASRFAPPKSPVLVLIATSAAGVASPLALLNGAFALAVLFAASAFGGYRSYVRKAAQYSNDLALYKKLWTCRDCGNIFRPPAQ
jgi:hypothetical protein